MTDLDKPPKQLDDDYTALKTLPFVGIVGYIAHKAVSHPNTVVTKELMNDAGFKIMDVHNKFTRFSGVNVHPIDRVLVKRYLTYNRLGWYSMIGCMIAQPEKYDTFKTPYDDVFTTIDAFGVLGIFTGCIRNATYSGKLLKHMGDAAHGTSRSLTANNVMFRGGMLGISSLLMLNFLLG